MAVYTTGTIEIYDADPTNPSANLLATIKPKTMSVDYDSLATEDSGRTDDGVMHIDWILSRARKVNITLPPMTQSEVGAILDKVSGRIYWIKYTDAIGGDGWVMNVYTSKSSTAMYSSVLASGGLWTDAAFNAIEMGGEG